MSVITAIEEQKKDKNRVSLYIDGQFYCGMALETILQNRIKVGQVVDRVELDQLQFESEKSSALDKALKHLSSAMKTEKETSDFLRRKGYVEPVIEYVLQKLRSYGFVDDEEYARQYVSFAGKNKGKRLVGAELQRKGVAADVAERIVERMEGQDEAAFAILQKYLRAKEITRENLYKATRYLLGKGFDYDTVKSAVCKFGDTDEDNTF